MKWLFPRRIAENLPDRHAQRISSILILACSGAYLLVGLIGLYLSDLVLVATMCGAAALMIIPFWLIKSGRLHSGQLSVVMIVLVSVTFVATVGQGIRDLAIATYPIVFICAGLILKRKMLRVCFALTFVAVLWLAFGETIGWFVTKPLSADPLNIIYLSGVTIVLIVAALAVDLLSANMRKLLKQANNELEEHRKTAARLEESERRNRILSEESSDLIHSYTPEGRFVYVNKAYADIFRERPENIAGKSLWDTFSREDADARFAVASEVFRTGREKIRETSISLAEESRFYLTAVTPIKNPTGKVTSVVCTSKDITERKRAEEALRISEEKFRSIVEQSTEGIVITNETGIISEWNSALEASTGLIRNNVVGLPLWEVHTRLAPDSSEKSNRPDQIRAGIEDALNSDGRPRREREYQIQRPDGSIRILLCSSFLSKSNAGSMMVAVMRDVTDAKNAEEERLQLEDYRQQVQRLESLGVLAGGIAHDFNNLLSAVFGNVELAQSRVEDASTSGYLSQAMQSVDRAKGLTQQLLTFSKGGAPNKRITSLIPTIKEIAKFSLSGSNVQPVFDLSDDLRQCNVDKNQIGQVLQNMVINAVQAMPLGGAIEITAKNVDLTSGQRAKLQKGTYVLISIKDQGIGIAKELLPRIFDPFFTTKTRGHGLGLATSFSIITRHDGAIFVDSEIGKGSVFHVYLPACDSSSSDKTNISAAKHAGEGRILVMDDEIAISTLLSSILQTFGYSCVCKNNSKDTIEYFAAETKANRQLSAVILDLTIPGGPGGKEVCAAIRETNASVPVFVASGYATDPIISNPQEYGFTAALCKPFTMTELAGMLEKHVSKKP